VATKAKRCGYSKIEENRKKAAEKAIRSYGFRDKKAKEE